MKKFILTTALIIICFCKILTAYSRYDYSFDMSPLITKTKMFSVGFGGVLEEYNAWFNNYEMIFTPLQNANMSLRNINFSFTPFFEFRYKKYFEAGVASPFIYKRQDIRHNAANTTNVIDFTGFEGIHGHIKVNMLDWYLSLALRFDIDYSLYKSLLPYSIKKDDLDITGNFMLAVVLKVIPLNFLFNYKFHTDKTLTKLGEILSAFEFITSPIINLYIGASYVFPYTKENTISYLEPFVKFAVKIGDFMYINAAYKKIVLGTGYIQNSSTFIFSIEYMFF